MAARYQLTPQLLRDIAAFIRAGGFPQVAAQAAGIPQHVFERWLKWGRSGKSRKIYRDFLDAVRQAQAQARLKAEITAFTDKPLDWLRSGPGKPTAESVGWTGPARGPRDEGRAAEPLLDDTIQELLHRVLTALAAFPEARAHVAAEVFQISNKKNGTP
jgi:hypothetical protein